MNRPRRWPILLALLSAAALIGWLVINATPVDQIQLSRGYSGAAQSNPLLAAERLLNRLGYAARGVAAPPDPTQLGRGDALVLSQPSFTFDERYSAALLTWLADGGTLLLAGQQHLAVFDPTERGPTERGTDHLLRRLNLEPQQTLDWRGNHTLPVDLEQRRYRLRPERLFASNGRFFAARRHGDGRVYLLAEIELFNNRRLADADHTDLLLALIGDPRPAQVWLQYAPAVPSLLALLWRYTWPLLCGLGVTLAALIWAAGRRLGPLNPVAESAQRSLLEHLAASGRFFWRHDRGRLLHAARHHARRALGRRFADWRHADRAPTPEQLDRLAAHTGLPADELRAALLDPAHGAAELVRRIRLLQALQKRL